MGRNNQERRKAKAKARARSRAQQMHARRRTDGTEATDPFTLPPPDPRELAEAAWALLLAGGNVPQRERQAAFTALETGDRATICRAAESPLLEQLDLLWANGWQPDDVLHHTRLALSDSKQRRLVGDLIAADHAGRESQTIDPRWQRQLRDAGLDEAPGRRGWLLNWSLREGLGSAQLVLAVLASIDALRVPPLDFLLPPPGRPDQPLASAPSTTDATDPVLTKVRQLLAKAESTEFEAEAAAFTTKAQELITRHAIDEALLAAERGDSLQDPTMIRVRVDPPYADAKNLLLHVVAEATRCRVVILGQVSMAAVMGTSGDLGAVEALYTSLLVQGQHALAETARSAPPGARTRSASYRSAFWLAYADRIGERLREVTEHTVGEATDADRLLPVLQSQADALDSWVEARFGELGKSRVRGGWDAAGWSQGRLAGDTAKIASGDLRPARRAIG